MRRLLRSSIAAEGTTISESWGKRFAHMQASQSQQEKLAERADLHHNFIGEVNLGTWRFVGFSAQIAQVLGFAGATSSATSDFRSAVWPAPKKAQPVETALE